MFRFENDTLIAEAKRDYDLRQAANDQEVKTQKAISDLARNLQGRLQLNSLEFCSLSQPIYYYNLCLNNLFRCKNKTTSKE